MCSLSAAGMTLGKRKTLTHNGNFKKYFAKATLTDEVDRHLSCPFFPHFISVYSVVIHSNKLTTEHTEDTEKGGKEEEPGE